MRKMLLMGVLATLSISSASASIIYNLTSVTMVGPNFEYTYNAVLSGDQNIDTARGRNFGVIYDFAGLVSATSINAVAGISVATFIEGTTTAPVGTFYAETGISNIRTEITGLLNVATATPIYQVVAVSTNPSGAFNEQAAQAVKDAPGDATNNTITGNRAQVEGPGTAIIPEPGSMALLGGGLLGIAMVLRRRKLQS